MWLHKDHRSVQLPSPKHRKVFRFRLGKGDYDIAAFLDSVPDREKSNTIKHLIRLALYQTPALISLHQKLDTLLDQMNQRQ